MSHTTVNSGVIDCGPSEPVCSEGNYYCAQGEDCIIDCEYGQCTKSYFECPSGPYNCDVLGSDFGQLSESIFNASATDGGNFTLYVHSII